MAIKAHEFDGRAWQDSLWPVTALIGDEAFFITRIGDLWRRAGRAQGFSERVVIDQTDTDAAAALRDELDALSLFADQSLVELRLARATLDGGLRDAISHWLDQPTPDKRLLIIGPSLGKAEANQTWAKTLDSKQAWITAQSLSTAQFPRWLDSELTFQTLRLDPDAKAALIQHTEGHLLAASQAIERLKLVQPDLLAGDVIGLDQVMEVLSQSARYSVYDLVDRALSGDVGDLTRMSDLLAAEGVEPMSVLWAIHREIDLLAKIRHRMDQGESANQAIGALRVWRSREGLVRTTVNRLSLMQLRRLLSLCHDIDRTIKGASKEPAWLMIKDVLMGLAGHPLSR